jgi:hypothetical protein
VTRPGPLPRGLVPALTGAFAVGLACSTLAPIYEVTCEDDDDCPTGEVCQNNECFPNTLPPPTQLGLDVAGADVDGLRVEIVGTDKSVERIVEQNPVRFRVRLNNANTDDPLPGVRDRLKLTVEEDYFQADEPKELKLPASLELSQGSRLRRDPVKAIATYAPFGEDME